MSQIRLEGAEIRRLQALPLLDVEHLGLDVEHLGLDADHLGQACAIPEEHVRSDEQRQRCACHTAGGAGLGLPAPTAPPPLDGFVMPPLLGGPGPFLGVDGFMLGREAALNAAVYSEYGICPLC